MERRRELLGGVDASKRAGEENPLEPMERFSARRLTRREKTVKREIDAYHVSEVDKTEVIYVGSRALSVYHSLDLPDAVCDGLTYKQRLIQTDDGDCMLIARWKPDRHMRRMMPEWSQKWFVDKQLFPPNPEEFFARHERRAEGADSEAAQESED
jgi:hypothetical protein